MSLLSIVQQACLRIGLPKPMQAASSTDVQILQLVALANEEGQSLSERYEWQALRQEATFTTVATEQQTTLAVTCPGLKSIINDTIWDRTLKRPIFGPQSAQRWQQLKALSFVGPWYQFRIFGGAINFIPVPSAGDACYFEYISRYWLYLTGDTTMGAEAFANDTDTIAFDEAIFIMGVIWRWKAAKGLDYAEDKDKYERRIMDAISADGSKDWLNLSDMRYDIQPGILVPSGNWPL